MADHRVNIRRGAYLPHWTRKGAKYFVTYRTADSLPPQAVEKLKAETRMLERKTRWNDLSPEEIARLDVLKSETYLKVLDDCYGACVFKREDCAKLVADTLAHFNDVQYRLWAWCVMPNHVHTVVEPLGEFQLPDIVQGWKSVSSRRVNRLLSTKGVFWQAEYFDRLIRDDVEFRKYVDYTTENPVVAGLKDWKWSGRYQA